MSVIDIEIMIDAIRNNPAIWDKTTDDYKDKFKTYTAWRRVYNTINEEFDHLPEDERTAIKNEVAKTWKRLTCKFRKYLSDVENSTHGETVKQYAHYEKMRFLHKVYGYGMSKPSPCVRPQTGNMMSYVESILNPTRPDPTKLFSEAIDSELWQLPDQSSSSLGQTDIDLSYQEPSTSEPEWKRRRVIKKEPEPEDPHLQFFKGILPNLADFNGDETMNFQMGVLQLIKNTKQARNTQAIDIKPPVVD